MTCCDWRKGVLLTAVFLLATSGLARAAEEIKELTFAQPADGVSDEARTLKSIVMARGIGEQYSTGGLYLITHFGDREKLFGEENQKAIDNPMINQTWRFCSLFSAGAADSVFMGRNWDNQNVGSIIVSLYRPAGGCSSISFSRSIDMGYPLNMDLEELREGELGRNLLLAPFHATEGINEHGLAVAVAGTSSTTHKTTSDEKLVCITFLIRKILDQAKNVEEATKLVERYIPFDLDRNSLNCHFLVADSSGHSVILEYDQDQWRKIDGDGSWQVLTNRPIYGVSDAKLKEKCWRYKSMSGALEVAKGKVDWRAGMKILQDVKQNGTTWSAVYGLRSREVYFSVYQKWDTIFHLKPF